jgi:hypothetical protein
VSDQSKINAATLAEIQAAIAFTYSRTAGAASLPDLPDLAQSCLDQAVLRLIEAQQLVDDAWAWCLHQPVDDSETTEVAP